MITPIHWAGAEPRFYNINRDLSPNLGDVERLLVPPVKALVLVHFFGFVQPAGKLRELCESRGVALIEDCAHAFIGRRSAGLPGNLARYSVASSRKFFPGADGGMLWAERDDFSDVRLESPSCLSQLKGIARSVQQAAEAGKLGWPSGFLSWTFGLLDRPGADSARSDRDPTVVGNEAQGDRHFDAAEVSRKGRAISRLFMRTTSINRMSRIRRRNYMAYVKGFSSMPHAKPLYPELDDAVVPYMFPLVIDDPGRNFAKLKNAGVPIWRWEDLSASDCRVSHGYLETLLQLPCHQELTTQDIDWIISRFGEICGDGDA